VQYGNLIRAPDKRTLIGKRDHALLRLLGDCGLRNAELRALAARAIRRPRANSTHHHLFVRGKGDVEREIPIPEATFAALEAWLRAHPQRRGGGLHDGDVLFVSLARARDSGHAAISQQGLAKLLRRYAPVAGVPDRLAHPHALRATTRRRSLVRAWRSRRSRPDSGTSRSRRPPAISLSSPARVRAWATCLTATTKPRTVSGASERASDPMDMTTTVASDAGETWFSLSAQIPPSPPDETPSLESVRHLSDAEMEQFRADVAVVRSVSRLAPYSRAFTAYRQVADLVDDLVVDAQGRPTARGIKQLRRALAAVSHAFAELPKALADAARLGECDAGRRLDEAIAEFVRAPVVQLSSALHDLSADQLAVVDVGDQRELVLPSDEPVGILSTVEAAIELAGHLLSRWLLEQRDIIDDASRRISALDGEVFRGASAVIEVRTAPREDGAVDVLSMTPTPLPLGEMYTVQHALASAERVLEDPDREPALRGVRAMTAEQIGAIAAVAEPGETVEDRQAPDEHDRPTDFAALVAHLHLGVLRLERAWSRALAEDDVKAMAAEWDSLLHALAAESQHADHELPEPERRLELPPTADTILALDTEPGSAVAERQARLAQVMAISDLVVLLPALREPTATVTDQAGRRVSWFSSGAFAMARDRLGLIAELGEIAAARPEAERSLHLSERAELRADPEATIVHLARAVKALDRARLAALGPYERALVDRVTQLAARIGAGDALDYAATTLIAHGSRDSIRAFVTTSLGVEMTDDTAPPG